MILTMLLTVYQHYNLFNVIHNTIFMELYQKNIQNRGVTFGLKSVLMDINARSFGQNSLVAIDSRIKGPDFEIKTTLK